MSPFDLFLASLAACAGFYALRFCQERGLSTNDLSVTLDASRSLDGKRLEKVRIQVDTPSDFPDKYRQAIVRAVDHCAVKKAIIDPPAFDIEVFAAVASQV